jgi:ankyrin repeat protein
LSHGADAWKSTKDGKDALFYAAFFGHSAIVQKLLEKRTSTEFMGSLNLALLASAQEGHESIVRLLLEAGANVNHVSKDQATPLILATHRGHTQIVRVLLIKNANPSIKFGNETALDIAKRKRLSKIVKMLSPPRKPILEWIMDYSSYLLG